MKILKNRLLFYPFTPIMSEHGGSGSSSPVTGKKTLCTSNGWCKYSAWRTNKFCQKGSTTKWWKNIYSKYKHAPSCG